MSDDIGSFVAETARRIFERRLDSAARLQAEGGAFLTEIWNELADAGLDVALAPESAGGSGLMPIDVLELIKAVGSHAVPLPLVEAMLARWIVGRSSVKALEGPLSIASIRDRTSSKMQRDGKGWRLQGRIKRVPWGRAVAGIVVVLGQGDKTCLALLDPRACTIRTDVNLAFEPRDDLAIDMTLNEESVGLSTVTPDEVHALGAAMRCITIAGAIEKILALTTAYALQRKQFGQPIGKFQAIRHHLAVLAAQSAAATSAAELACAACGDAIDQFAIGIAKARCGEAAGVAAAIAHQVHGAIGFTQEHSLHFFTKRLWSWRDEFGNESEWNERVGGAVASAGPEGFWPLIAIN